MTNMPSGGEQRPVVALGAVAERVRRVGRAARCAAARSHSSTSLPASAIVCSVSANSAGEPVSAAAMPLAIAIVVFAASAAKTLPALWSRAVSDETALKGSQLVHAGAYSRPGSASFHSARVSVRPATVQACCARADGRTSQR